MTDHDPNDRLPATGHDPNGRTVHTGNEAYGQPMPPGYAPYGRPVALGLDPYGRPLRFGPPPGLSTTIVITILFGLFGLIPAYLHSRKAEEGGYPSGRYWVAFGVSLAGSAVAYILVVLAAVAFFFSAAGSSSGIANSAVQVTEPVAPTGSPAPSTASTNADGTIDCTYTADDSGNPNLIDVGTPPRPEATPAQGTQTLRMSTNQGDLALTLDRTKAPCAAASFAYLALQKFFDGSPCHREVNEPTFGVLQCGDPTGSGSGGPTYKFAQELPSGTTYPRGTIAMANTGQPNSTGSQFFLCFTDTQLSPDYSPVGTVDAAGLAVLDKIAAAGNNGSFASQAGGGAPNTPVTINKMAVVG